ncbi:MAG: hypothetical protein GEU77_19290 [Deltaproteobacteria bacterium]|nr:hypothetical protein [Deltaproteobacteria bacterium]
MSEKFSENAVNIKDALSIGVLVVYFGCLLAFSSFFYLATEDYEAVAAVDFIAQGRLIGKSTGWPYTPLAGYFFYLYSLAFDNSLLGFRLATVVLLVVSIFPIYFILRTLCDSLTAFALTLLSFSLSTFPHPRLEYFIEGAFAAFAIFFAVRFLQTNRWVYIYDCALFGFLAYGSRGHPISSVLLVLLPAALIVVPRIVDGGSWGEALRQGTMRWVTNFTELSAKRPATEFLNCLLFWALISASTGFVLAFLRNAVYKRSLTEYVAINHLTNSSEVPKQLLKWLLLLVAACAYLFTSRLSVGRTVLKKVAWSLSAIASCIKFSAIASCIRLSTIGPFILVGIMFVALGIWAGYSIDELIFFIFPTDIIIDHSAVGRIGGGPVGLVPMFFVLVATTLYMYLNNLLPRQKTTVSLFLLLLLPATFARFFPGYNMLYLGVFAVAVFVGCILPAAMENWTAAENIATLKKTVAIFFVIYAVASNYFLLVQTQWDDLANNRLVEIEGGALDGILVERDVMRLFEDVQQALDSNAEDDKQQAFFSHRYLKFVPLLNNGNDVVAGQNLMIHLGKLWSYDGLVKVEGVMSENKLDWPNLVYSWREAAVEKLENAGVAEIIMSLYDEKVLDEELPSSDPFRKYLNDHFVLSHVFEPAMIIHRRSTVPEGAVIFSRKLHTKNELAINGPEPG